MEWKEDWGNVLDFVLQTFREILPFKIRELWQIFNAVATCQVFRRPLYCITFIADSRLAMSISGFIVTLSINETDIQIFKNKNYWFFINYFTAFLIEKCAI